MKTRDLSTITLNKKAWKRTKKNEELPIIAGMDTETRKGKAFLIGINKENNENIHRLRNFQDYIRVIQEERLDETNNFYYNLTYDYQAIIKHLTEEQLDLLAMHNELVEDDWSIHSTPDKRFRITIGKKHYDFYDLAQFYGHQPLDKVAKSILGIGKEDLGSIDIKNLMPDKYDKGGKYREVIDGYLRQDIKMCRLLGERLQRTCKPFLKPKYYYSQASPSQQYYLENASRDMKLPSRNILQAGLQAYNGGRFEVFKRGTYTHAVTYDIKSAYPYHNANIPAMDKGKWTANKKYDSEELLGLYQVIAEGKSHVSPLRHEDKNGLLYYPEGRKVCWVNHEELRVIKDYGYKTKILQAFHYNDDNPEYPYAFLKKFYEEKERVGRDSPDYMFYKLVINGFYGKTIQLTPDNTLTDNPKGAVDEVIIEGKKKYIAPIYKAGLLFNPIIAQEITGNTRAQLLRAVIDQQDSVISFATDGITTQKRPNIRMGDNMGEWGVEAQGRFTSIGSGVYFYDHQESMKFRGFGRGYNPKSVFNNKNASSVKLPVMRNNKLKKTYRSKKDGYEDLNVLFETEKELDLNFDKKRVWLDRFNKVSDVYDKQIESNPRVI